MGTWPLPAVFSIHHIGLQLIHAALFNWGSCVDGWWVDGLKAWWHGAVGETSLLINELLVLKYIWLTQL